MSLPTFKIEIICRVCFKGVSSGYLSLACPSGFDILASIKEVLKDVIPEMVCFLFGLISFQPLCLFLFFQKMDLINDSCICYKCWSIVSAFYRLKLQCLQNEQNFHQFLAKNGDTGDIPVFLKQEPDDEAENKPLFSLNESDPLAVAPDLQIQEQTTIVIDDNSDVETVLLNEISNNEKQVR